MATARSIDIDRQTSAGLKRRRVRHAAAVLLASAFAVTACSDGPNPMGPAAQAAPDASASATCMADDGFTPVKVAHGNGATVKTRVIGPNGGRLNVGQNELVVPAGTVDEPTLFVMEAQKEHVAVELNAYRLDDDNGGRGTRGAPALRNPGSGPPPHARANASAFDLSGSDPVNDFDPKVKLYLSYRHADVDDPESLEITELKGDPSSCDALGESVTTGHDEKRQRIEAELDHFSGYIMVAG